MKDLTSSVHEITADFWNAARIYRTTKDREERHRARVTLIGIAFGDSARVAERALDLLAKEGLIVHRATQANSA